MGGRALATLAVNRGLFLGAPRPVEGHRRQWPSWPSIISYPDIIYIIIYAGSEMLGKKCVAIFCNAKPILYSNSYNLCSNSLFTFDTCYASCFPNKLEENDKVKSFTYHCFIILRKQVKVTKTFNNDVQNTDHQHGLVQTLIHLTLQE